MIQVLSRRGDRARRSRATCSWSIAKTTTWPRSRVSAPLLKRYQQTLAAFVDGARDVLQPPRHELTCWPATTRCRSSNWSLELLAQPRTGAMTDADPQHALRVAMGLAGAVPPAIVALYFLKLKRQPLEVPSTYLWQQSIEDLHVNSLWQRMRQSLLLFLQLLLIGDRGDRAAAAVVGKGSSSKRRSLHLSHRQLGQHECDRRGAQPARRGQTPRRQLLDEMDSGSKAMIISFSDTAQVEQSFTDNMQELRRAVDAIRPTNRSTSLDEALRVAAGLANPNTSSEVGEHAIGRGAAREALHLERRPVSRRPRIFAGQSQAGVCADRHCPTRPTSGIVAFSTGRGESHPEQLQAFARLENHGPQPATVGLELYLDGQLLDARQTKIAAGDSASEAFALGSIDRGLLRLAITTPDVFLADNQAWAVINPSRRARVLLDHAGNEPLQRALTVPSAQQWAEVTQETPAVLKTADYKKQAAAGAFDLIIYDRCRPDKCHRPTPGSSGVLPPTSEWSVRPILSSGRRSSTPTAAIRSCKGSSWAMWIFPKDVRLKSRPAATD